MVFFLTLYSLTRGLVSEHEVYINLTINIKLIMVFTLLKYIPKYNQLLNILSILNSIIGIYMPIIELKIDNWLQ